MLGIDVGGTNIRAGLVSLPTGAVCCVRATHTEASRGGSHALARAVALAREVAEQGEAIGLSVAKVGIGVPELVDTGGRIESHCSLPWRSNQVRARLRKFGEVTIASDVRAAAWAETRPGAGRAAPTFPYVSLGTGISCTLVLDGKPHSGAHGHAISFASGPTFATSGVDGKLVFESLEGRASGPGLLRRAQFLGLTAPDAIAVCRTALKEPGIARDIVDAAATELAIHVAILANALDPRLIIHGGGLGCARGRYRATSRAALPRFTWGPYASRIQVRRAALGTNVGIIGAALSALENV